MASEKGFVNFVIDQIDLETQITFKKMFGEYALYFDNKLFALICDNKVYIKPTTAGKKYINNVVEAPPYPGAKPSFLIEEKLEDRDWLQKLVIMTVEELPEPKPTKVKAPATSNKNKRKT